MIRLALPEVGKEELDEIAAVLDSGYLTGGPKVAQFEAMLAAYLGVRSAVAGSSGTAALHLTLLALEIGPGDEVIVPDFTFPAPANAAILAGARPVLGDIDLGTYNLDPVQIEGLVTPRTKAIVVVHQFGLAADMGPIMEVVRRYGLWVIEDAACALGAEYRGRKCGTLGDVACFSFHPRKVITTGEGGAVVSDRDDITQRVRLLRNHGLDPSSAAPHFIAAGFNYRLSDLHAAVGVAQMKKIDRLIAHRRALAQEYDGLLSAVEGLTLPYAPPGYKHIYQSYVVALADRYNRDEVVEALRRRGVEVTLGTYAIHAQPYWQEYCQRWGSSSRPLPNSGRAYRTTMALPLYAQMGLEGVKRVVHALQEALA